LAGIAMALCLATACAPSMPSKSPTPTATPAPSSVPSALPSPSPALEPPSAWPVVYTTSDGRQFDALTWHGTPAGAINVPAVAETDVIPSPDGRMLLAWPWVINAQGAIIATINVGSAAMRDVAWSESGDQLCIVTSAANQGPDQGALRIDTDTPGAPVHFVGTVSIFAGGPSIAACDPATNRLVILNVYHAHEGGGGPAFSEVLATWVFSLSAGKAVYHASYPGTDSGLSATQVIAAPNGRYLAVSRDRVTDVRNATTGQLVGAVAGSMGLGFSGDADASLLAVVAAHGNGPLVWNWASKRVVWSSTQDAQWAFPDPGVAEILVGVVHANEGLDDIIAVTASGRTITLGLNVMLSSPCPCPVEAGLAY
jgi:hypothetical protein